MSVLTVAEIDDQDWSSYYADDLRSEVIRESTNRYVTFRALEGSR